MNLDPESVRIHKEGDDIVLELDGERMTVDRVARAFPNTRPNDFISFLDELGHEIGLLESTADLEPESRDLLREHLRAIYFVPTIEEIVNVEVDGTRSHWVVNTDDGEREFDVHGRDSLYGEKPPMIRITDSHGRRYQIPDYWALDKASRQEIRELLPDKILKSRLAARRGRGMTMRMR